MAAEFGSAGPPGAVAALEPALEVLRHDLVERRLLGAAPLVAAGRRGPAMWAASDSRGKRCDRGDRGDHGRTGGWTANINGRTRSLGRSRSPGVGRRLARSDGISGFCRQRRGARCGRVRRPRGGDLPGAPDRPVHRRREERADPRPQSLAGGPRSVHSAGGLVWLQPRQPADLLRRGQRRSDCLHRPDDDHRRRDRGRRGPARRLVHVRQARPHDGAARTPSRRCPTGVGEQSAALARAGAFSG